MLSEGTVRILFSKTGKIKYISHLDLNRTLKSAFIRARIPLKYSEGFNPRPKMAFALTVSVGSESLCELLDIGITEPMDEKKFVEALSNSVTGDIRIKKVYNPTTKFTELCWSEYEITAENDFDSSEIEEMMSSPMIVKKHGKKGDVDTDIRPMIKEFHASGNKLNLILSASQGNYLNPEYFMKALNAETGDKYPFYSIIRVNIYREDMTVFE